MIVLPASSPSNSRRSSKGFTLLELIVVVVVVGVLALIAVPSFSGVINGTSASTVEATASGIVRDATSLAAFNSGASVNVVSDTNVDAAVAEAALNTANGWTVDTSAGTGATISLTKNGKECSTTITVAAGAVSASVASCSAPAGGGGGGGGSYAYTITPADLGGWGSCNYVSPGATTTLALYCMGGASATGIAAINSLAPGDTFELSFCDGSLPGSDCNNNGAGPAVSEVLTFTVASVVTGGPWTITTVESMPGLNVRAIVGLRM
jgi:type IV pilus assembly protein PilA